MKIKNFKPVLVLSAICVAVALLLGLVNLATKKKIAKDQLVADNAALTSVLDTKEEPKQKDLPKGVKDTVKELYEVAGVGYVVRVEGKGYNDIIKMTVGVIDLAVNKVIVTYENESHGKSLNTIYESFIDLERVDVDSVEAISGATISSGVVKNLVKDALDCAIKAASGPVDDSKGIYLDEAKKIISDTEITKDELSEDAPEGIVESYSDANGRRVIIAKGQGYAGEIILAVGVDKDGRIIKLSFIENRENPPNVDLNGFYNSFTGVSGGEIDGIESVAGATYTSGYVKGIVKNAVAYATGADLGESDSPNKPEDQKQPKTDEEIEAIVEEMTGAVGQRVDLIAAPEALKALYKVEGGYVAYTLTSTQYNPLETEVLTYFDENGTVIKSNLVTWIVGHKTEPGDFADRFTGKTNEEIGSVELIVGTTGTSTNYRDAVKAASDYVIRVQKISNALIEMAGADYTVVELDSGAPAVLKALYKVEGGYIAYTVTSTQDNPLETEVLTHFDEGGRVIKSNLITWIVGHKTEPGDFADRFTGKENGEIGSVELIVGTTGTSTNYRDAVKAASDYVLLLERVPNLIKEKVGLEGTKVEIDGAPDVLKALYRVEGGYVAYTVTNTQYNPLETEVLTHFDNNGTVIKSYLITWIVGGGVPGPDNLADRFTGKENAEIGSVELIVGTTGTSTNYRNAVKAASDYILLNLEPISDERIVNAAGKIFGEDCQLEKIAIKETKFIGKAFSGCNGAYAVLIKTVTADGNRAIEAVVGIKDGKIVGINIINDFVQGREGEPTVQELQGYLKSFVGKSIDELANIELVGTSDTAKNIKKSVKASMRALDKYLTERAEAEKSALYEKIDNVIGMVLIALAIPAIPVIVIITTTNEKRRGQNEKQ